MRAQLLLPSVVPAAGTNAIVVRGAEAEAVGHHEAAAHLGRIAVLAPDVAAAYADRLVEGLRRGVAFWEKRCEESQGSARRDEEKRLATSRAILAYYERSRAVLPVAAVLRVNVPRVDGATDSPGCVWARYARDVPNPVHPGLHAGVCVEVSRYQRTPRTPSERSIYPSPAWRVEASIDFPDYHRTSIGDRENYGSLDEAV